MILYFLYIQKYYILANVIMFGECCVQFANFNYFLSEYNKYTKKYNQL